jgi:hypothetical protein
MASDLLLLGFDRPERALDVGAIEERFRRPDFAAGFERVGIESFPALLAHELLPVGTLHATALDGELHTLRHPILSHRAARAFFRGRTAALPRFATLAGARIGWQNSLLRRYAGGAPQEPLPEPVLAPAVRETCQRMQQAACATLFARWKRDHPESARLGAALDEWQSKAPVMLVDETLAEISVLFGGGKIDDLPGDTPLPRARQASRNFLLHYHHAVPFDRRVLRVLWNRCTAEPCTDARRRVEERLGRFARRAGQGGQGGGGEAREPPDQD